MLNKPWLKTDNAVLLLLFLFPLAGTFVRHWISGIFALLFLFSLYYLFARRGDKLLREEKVWLWVLFAYFAVFIITALANGWSKEQTTWVGLELRFLAIIPIYLMLRQIPLAGRALLYGLIAGVIMLGIWGIYELYLMDGALYEKLTPYSQKMRRTNGIYGPLFLGPVGILMIALLLPAMQVMEMTLRRKLVLSLFILLGLYAVANSWARSAYLAFVVLTMMVLFYYNRNRKFIVGLFVVVIATAGILATTSKVKQRIITAEDQFISYFTEKDPAHEKKLANSSIGIRLEMWRGSWYLFRESPLFGVGRGNYNQAMQKYIDKGMVHPAVNNHGHPHSAYMETLASRGILGMVVMLLLLYYPLYVFFKTRKQSPHTALMGMIHIIAISIFSITEAATFIKGNFVAINLLFLAVFYSWHLRETARAEA